MSWVAGWLCTVMAVACGVAAFVMVGDGQQVIAMCCTYCGIVAFGVGCANFYLAAQLNRVRQRLRR
jgi:hypothetical protein